MTVNRSGELTAATLVLLARRQRLGHEGGAGTSWRRELCRPCAAVARAAASSLLLHCAAALWRTGWLASMLLLSN